MTMTREISSYYFDHATKAIYFTNASFLRRANKVGSREYSEVCGLRRDFPGYEFKKDLREGITSRNKGLSIDDMKDYISENMSKEEAEKLLDEMAAERAKHSLDSNPYKAVQAWFFEKFPNVKAQKDAEAKLAKAKRAAAKKEE